MYPFNNSLIYFLFLSISFVNTSLMSDIFKLKKINEVFISYEKDLHKTLNVATPYVDWRLNGKVSPVKNQETCAACWAFSVVANIESQLRIYRHQNVTLSEQFLIDCVPSSKGCGPGSLVQTYSEIVSVLGGVLSEDDYYPYASAKLECRWHNKNIKPVPVIGFKRVYPSEEVMVEYVESHGPLSAAINSKSMQSYGGGIDEPSDEKCSPGHLDHTVLIVGFSTYVSKETGRSTPYWIIKNSWGTNWGDKGYYYLVRGRNACGIASDFSQGWWAPPPPDPFITEFEWVQDDPQFDCIVPITYYSQILNSGCFIRSNLIVTSVIPLESIFKWPTYMKVYMIKDTYNYSSGMYAVHSVGDIWGKTYFWVWWGYRRYERNPVHDLMFLYMSRHVGNTSNAEKRVPYFVPVAKRYDMEEPSGWRTAAFALTDYRHVKKSSKLVPIYWDEPVLVDCDEYIPRYWGYFICIMNIDKYPVIHSGAPLMKDNKIWGVASFSLRRGRESIYAYTDLRPYRRLIYTFYTTFFATKGPWYGK